MLWLRWAFVGPAHVGPRDRNRETYNINLPAHAHLGDLRTLTAHDLPDCDGIVGGPPCQPFSNGHRNERTKKGPFDNRNILPDFVRLVAEKLPPFFLIENVPGLLQYPAFLAEQMSKLFDVGYWPVPIVLVAWRFGVPQERRRLFIVGWRNGRLPLWPTPIHHRRDKSVSTWTAIGHLLNADLARPKPSWIEKKFRGRDRIQTDTRNRGYTPKKGRYFHARSIDLPAYTVLASERNGSKTIIIGDNCWPQGIEHNKILQTFPATWRLPADHDTAQRLIGNAVPPVLAQCIGQVIEVR
jgi:DNA (cytosine-5)-methyltransferase 1